MQELCKKGSFSFYAKGVKSLLLFLTLLILIPFSLATDLGYNNPTIPTLQPEIGSTGTILNNITNYSINVNSAENWVTSDGALDNLDDIPWYTYVGNLFDQWLNTTDDVLFNSVNVTENLTVDGIGIFKGTMIQYLYGYNHVRLGLHSGTPRIIFEREGSTGQIDYNAETLRFIMNRTTEDDIYRAVMRINSSGVRIGEDLHKAELIVKGNVTADYFIGDGSNLTGISNPTLQQVTDEGATTTNDINLSGSNTKLIQDSFSQYFDGTNQRYALTSGAFKFNKEMFVDGQSITYGATGGSPSNTDNYHYQDALVWHHDSHNKDGAFVITLPSVGNSMSVFKIRGFNYGHSDGGNWEAIVSGYWRTSTGTWLYPSVDIIGTPPFSSVRLGKDATNMPVIILGEFTDTGLWDYPQITMDIYAGFQSQNGYATGVSAALVTDNTGYTGFVTPTMKNYYLDNGDFVFNGGNVGIGTANPGSNLEVFDSVDSTITIHADEGTANLNIDTRASSNNKFATLSFKDKNALRYAWIFRQATDDFYLYDYLNAKFVMRYDQSESDLLLGESGNVDVVAGNDLNVLGTLDVTGDTNIIGNSNVDGLSQSDMFQPTHLNTGSSTTYKRLVGANGGFVSNIGVTGAMVITIPENKNEMFTMHIKGFNYETTHSTWSIDFSAYTRDDGGTWLKDSAIVHGNLPNNLIRVAVNSDNKKYLIIGDVDSVWRYPLVTIDTEVAFATSDWTTGVTYEYLEVLPDTDVELREVAGQVDYKFDGIDVKEDYSIGGANIIISNNLDVNGITTMNGEGRVVPADDNDDAFNVRNTADTADRIRMGLVTGDGRLQVLDDGGNVHVNLQGDADNYFMNNVGIGVTDPATTLDVNGITTFRDAVYFTQTDGNEYIDSIDNYMTYGATLGHNFNAPITIASKALLGTQVAGTLEFYDNKMYVTNKSVQKVIDRTSDVQLTTVTVANEAAETEIWHSIQPANSLVAGNMMKFHADGVVSTGATNQDFVLRVRLGAIDGPILISLTVTSKKLDDDHWHMDANATQRTITVGETDGTRAYHVHLDVNGDDEQIEQGIVDIDTEATMDLYVTIDWDTVSADNSISLYQAYMEYKN